MKTLYLLRHGKTIANEEKRYCGSTDLSLSDTGIQPLQWRQTYHPLPYADRYVVSGLKRTVETLQILFPKTSYDVIEGFSEIAFGDFEMKTYEELKEEEAYIAWIMDLEKNQPPHGEGYGAFQQRLKIGLEKLSQLYQSQETSTITVVTHGGVIATMMSWFFPNQKNFYEWQSPCGYGYALDFNQHGLLKSNRVIQYPEITLRGDI